MRAGNGLMLLVALSLATLASSAEIGQIKVAKGQVTIPVTVWLVVGEAIVSDYAIVDEFNIVFIAINTLVGFILGTGLGGVVAYLLERVRRARPQQRRCRGGGIGRDGEEPRTPHVARQAAATRSRRAAARSRLAVPRALATRRISHVSRRGAGCRHHHRRRPRPAPTSPAPSHPTVRAVPTAGASPAPGTGWAARRTTDRRPRAAHRR